VVIVGLLMPMDMNTNLKMTEADLEVEREIAKLERDLAYLASKAAKKNRFGSMKETNYKRDEGGRLVEQKRFIT
jgi:hypothetical protein